MMPVILALLATITGIAVLFWQGSQWFWVACLAAGIFWPSVLFGIVVVTVLFDRK